MNTEEKLAEFVAAQAAVYDQVCRELAAARKQTHRIWFIFPQLAGLGFSPMSRKFGIASKAEAHSYLKHAVLRPRLHQCTELVIGLPDQVIHSVLGSHDDLKFHSSMTLFAAAAAPEESIFGVALTKFFGGKHDPHTISLLQEDENAASK